MSQDIHMKMCNMHEYYNIWSMLTGKPGTSSNLSSIYDGNKANMLREYTLDNATTLIHCKYILNHVMSCGHGE